MNQNEPTPLVLTFCTSVLTSSPQFQFRTTHVQTNTSRRPAPPSGRPASDQADSNEITDCSVLCRSPAYSQPHLAAVRRARQVPVCRLLYLEHDTTWRIETSSRAANVVQERIDRYLPRVPTRDPAFDLRRSSSVASTALSDG